MRPHSRATTILDLGCGTGKWPRRLAAPPDNAALIGVDISHKACLRASQQEAYPRWICVCARGEQLPLPEDSVDSVISNVAIPYMHIPTALDQIRQVLRPGGSVNLSLHPFSFWLHDFRKHPPTRPNALLYRLYVAANGLLFHLTGRLMRYPLSRRRVESWQSQRGMRIALERAGFADIYFAHLPNGSFVVNTLLPDLAEQEELAAPAAA